MSRASLLENDFSANLKEMKKPLGLWESIPDGSRMKGGISGKFEEQHGGFYS